MLGLDVARVGLNSRRGAALDLDFLAGAVDGRIAFSRPSAATRVNAAGLLETVAAGAPRIDYDPVTLACRGLLVEEQRTNLLLRSAEFDVSPWSASASSVSPNAGTAPDGTTTADKLVESTATSTHFVSQAVSASLGTPYTASVYVKPAGRSAIRIRATTSTDSFIGDFDAGAGAVSGTSVVGSGTAAGATITPVSGGWYRCTLTGQFAAGVSPQVDVWLRSTAGSSFPSYTGDGASAVFLWGAQFEAGSFATSHIPTATAQTTRATDAATLPLGAWFNASEGTLWGEGLSATTFVSTNQFLAEISDGSTANRLIVDRGVTPGAEAYVFVAGVSTPFPAVAAWPALTVQRLALAYRANDTAAAAGGNVVTAGAIATPTAVSTLTIGNSTGQGLVRAFNGHIRRLRYYRTRLSNAQLQALTA